MVFLYRYYTSVPLVEELRDSGLSVVGTVRSNRLLLPKELTTAAGREAGSTLACYRNDVQLVSHCPRSGKVVTVLSSQHKVSVVDRNTGKPESVLYYNSTKGGVDVIDAMMESTQSRGVVRRWPTRVFTFMLAAACLNGHFIYTTRFPASKNADVRHGGRRRYVQALAEQLTLAQVQRRADLYRTRGILKQPTVAAITSVLGEELRTSSVARAEDEAGPSRQPPSGPEKGRCRLCLIESHGPGHKRRRTSMWKVSKCSSCHNFACPRHSKMKKVCEVCYDEE